MRAHSWIPVVVSVEDAWEPQGFRYLDERDANAFAASLLMDERWLRRDFANGVRTIPALAKRCAVSPAAMGFRLANLGLVWEPVGLSLQE